MKSYYESIGKDVFDYLPVTFHISKGIEDPEFKSFTDMFNDIEN